jgi:hypothetical protein
MSLIDLFLVRRSRRSSTALSKCTPTYRPRLEVLEVRQCLSVAAPTGLHAVALSPTEVKLTWHDVVGEQGFRIFRRDGTQSILVSSVARGVTAFTVTKLQPNTTQIFSVEAHDLTTSASSAWVAIMTPADPITAPTHVHITAITETSMTLQWTNARGATGYRIYGWDGANAIQIGTTTPNVPAFTVNNLTPGVSYHFYVQAFNNTNSAISDWVSAATLSPGITAPAELKTQVISTGTIGLSWKNVANAAGYRVYLWNGNASSTPVVIANLAANKTGFQATGLLPGTTYWFYVQAFKATNFANTAWVTATTVAAIPLEPPTNLAVQINGPNSVVLSWVEPARAAGYRVFEWTGTSWSLVTTVPVGTHTLPINSLTAHSTHWFYVQAFTDNFAEVSYSSAVFANL